MEEKIPQVFDCSILWQYYARGKKLFSKLIEVSGYITEEKVEIARRHLVPKELEANGIKKEYVKFSKAALECIVENYTRKRART